MPQRTDERTDRGGDAGGLVEGMRKALDICWVRRRAAAEYGKDPRHSHVDTRVNRSGNWGDRTTLRMRGVRHCD